MQEKQHECVVAVQVCYDRKYFHTWPQVKKYVKEEIKNEGFGNSYDYCFLERCTICHKELQLKQNRWKYEAII